MKNNGSLPSGKRNWLIISGILGFSGVALGAFGAHALKDALTSSMIETYKTGITYHLIHTAVITSIALAGDQGFYRAALFFLLGIVLFSCSLYLYSITGIRWLAMITPFGGVSFLAGWAIVIAAAIKKDH